MNKSTLFFIVVLVLAVGCQPAPTSTPAPTPVPPTATAIPPTATAIPPTATAAPTETPRPTATATPDYPLDPHITAGNWASFEPGDKGYEEKLRGNMNPEKMFSVTGCINKAHHSTLDLEFGTMKIAFNTGKAITAANHNLERIKAAKILEGQKDLISQLKSIRAQMADRYKDEVDFRNFTVLIENGKAVQAIYRKGEIIERYAIKDSADGINLERMEYFALLPQLRVEGPYIVRTDNVPEEDKRIQFKGVNLNNFLDVDSPTFVSAKHYIDVAEEHGSNLLRMMVDIDKVAANMEEFDKVIRYVETRGMYVIIVPSYKGFMKTPLDSPSTEIEYFMKKMATRYRDKPNVMYGLLNELKRSIGWENEIPGLAKIATAITEANPDAVLFVPGGDWNRKFKEYLDNPAFPFSQVVFDVHYYLRLDASKNDITSQHYPDLTTLLERQKPILIGEAGVAIILGGLSHPEDATKIKVAIGLVREHPKQVHYTGFAVFWPGGRITSRGRLYFDDMQDPTSVRQTNFTK